MDMDMDMDWTILVLILDDILVLHLSKPGTIAGCYIYSSSLASTRTQSYYTAGPVTAGALTVGRL